MSDEMHHHLRRRVVLVTAAVVVALLAGVAGVVLGVAGQIQNSSLQEQRNEDRIASDLAGCQRGNEFRQQVIDLGFAVRAFQVGQLDVVLPHDSGNPRVEEVRDHLDLLIGDLTTAVGKVQLVDCKAVTPGAK